MRRLVVAGIIAIAAHGAEAADLPDMPILRGSFREAPVAYRTIWQGFYVGGQAGYGASNVDFGDFNSGLIERLTADPAVLQGLPFAPPPWPSLEPATHRNTMFGAFAGYNAQYENVVLGFEGNYMHGTFNGSAFGRNTRSLQIGATLLNVSTESAASMRITDFGSLRVRGGYEMGSFFPICLPVSAWAWATPRNMLRSPQQDFRHDLSLPTPTSNSCTALQRGQVPIGCSLADCSCGLNMNTCSLHPL